MRQIAGSGDLGSSIVPVLDAGLEDTTPFLVMPHQSGDTLDVAIRRIAPASLDQALPLLASLAAAVDTAWAHGRGHGLLHPRDIFLGTNNRASGVTGFGISGALEQAGISIPLRRPYMAPERTGGTWDIRADIYSLAAIAHEVLTKRRPGGAGEQDGVFSAGLAAGERVTLRRALISGLAERPEERFSTATEFVQALEDAVGRKSAEVIALAGPAFRAPFEGAINTAEPPAAPDVTDLPLFVAAEGAPAPEVAEPVRDASARVLASRPVLVAPIPSRAEHADKVAALTDETMLPSERGRAEQRPTPVELAELWLSRVQTRPSRSASMWPFMAVATALFLVAIGAGLTYQMVRGARTSSAPPAAGVVESAAARLSAPGPEPPPAPPVTESAPEIERPPLVPAVTQAIARPAGRLVVRSQPSGAMVTLDGRLLGDTPLTLNELSLGTHALLIARPGHVPRLERVTLSSRARERTLMVELTPAPSAEMRTAVRPASAPAAPSSESARATPAAAPAVTFGSVEVVTEPRGARVTIDGQFIGRAPLRAARLSPGTHVISVDLDGYLTVTRSVAVLPGRVVRVTPELVRQ